MVAKPQLTEDERALIRAFVGGATMGRAGELTISTPRTEVLLLCGQRVEATLFRVPREDVVLKILFAVTDTAHEREIGAYLAGLFGEELVT